MHDEDIEIGLLLEAVFQKYGYDFRSYSRSHIKRRVLSLLQRMGLANVSALQHHMLYAPGALQELLSEFSINVTEMFRDPDVYRALRQHVVPLLQPEPHLKVWHAGCATGEEVYSMAILFHEAGLLQKTQAYATDLNEAVLQKARAGIYPVHLIQAYTSNYQKAGGNASFADYYTARYDSAMLAASLKRHIVFANHNLVTDGVFGEMNLIVCRNVLIYFARELQDRVIGLFYDSLAPGGILCLGSKETVRFTSCAERFEVISEAERIYRKIPETEGK